MKSRMVCPECGENIYSTWNYCAYCGSELDIEQMIIEAIQESDGKTDFNENTQFSSTTVSRVFGSWKAAKEAARQDAEDAPEQFESVSLDADEAATLITDLTEELGHPPSQRETDDHLDPSPAAFYSALGVQQWDEVLRKSGIHPCRQCDKWFESSVELGGHTAGAHS